MTGAGQQPPGNGDFRDVKVIFWQRHQDRLNDRMITAGETSPFLSTPEGFTLTPCNYGGFDTARLGS
jgi:hypothetical protein